MFFSTGTVWPESAKETHPQIWFAKDNDMTGTVSSYVSDEDET